MLTREEMLDKVIAARGFEDEMTVDFAQFIEDSTHTDNACLCYMVAILMMPYDEEE